MLRTCLLEHQGLIAASDGLWDRHLELASFGWLVVAGKWQCHCLRCWSSGWDCRCHEFDKSRTCQIWQPD